MWTYCGNMSDSTKSTPRQYRFHCRDELQGMVFSHSEGENPAVKKCRTTAHAFVTEMFLWIVIVARQRRPKLRLS